MPARKREHSYRWLVALNGGDYFATDFKATTPVYDPEGNDVTDGLKVVGRFVDAQGDDRGFDRIDVEVWLPSPSIRFILDLQPN